MPTPTVFISYSHDSDAHKDWAVSLANKLRRNGVDAILDRYRLVPGQDISMFMQNGIANADRVLLICTEPYVAKAEECSGGVGYERLIITAELIQGIDTRKFIPIIRDNPSARIPNFLGPRFYIDFNDDSLYEDKYEELLRELLGARYLQEPTIGPNPFSATVPPVVDSTSGTTSTRSIENELTILDDLWFQSQEEVALRGIAAMSLSGSMEFCISLKNKIGRSQLKLLEAVRESKIRTFGWPIGILLENSNEFKPRPFSDGIRAEISVPVSSLRGAPSYDYWALKMTGEFYLLQSLFEDQRRDNMIFFNTRIVRVAEAFLFASNLYNNLGVSPEERLSARVVHRGLSGRTLGSSTSDRYIEPVRTTESSSQGEFATSVSSLRENIVDHVKQILAPMFTLFEYETIEDGVYSDIVNKFINGYVT